jgi:hypothetical protein
MKPNFLSGLAGLALVASLSAAAHADPTDYEFRLLEHDVTQSVQAVLAVTLIDRRTGVAVPDAVIFATRMDMAPDGMATMTSALEAITSAEAGTYRFRTNLMMAGNWRFSLAAKVQGEHGTVQGQLFFRALP